MTLSNFGLARFAPAFAVIYFVVLCMVLLYPFHFSGLFATVENTAEGESDGVYFGTSGMLRSITPPTALYDRLNAGKGLTLEIWLNTAAEDQDRARIISYSLDPWHRNFTLAQEGNGLNIRLRTTKTDHNGIHPDLRIPAVFRPGTTQHVVMAYDFQQQRIYVDGKQRAATAVPGGDFQNWDPSCFLVFGNEATGARAWRGTISYAAIYDKPLSADSVAAHYQAGRALHAKLKGDGPLLAFDFTRGLGGLENNTASVSTVSPIPPLKKPVHIHTDSRLILSFFRGADRRIRLAGDAPTWDVIRNVILFVPFGLLLCSSLDRHFRSTALAVFTTVLVGIFVSASLEGLQILLPERTSSIFDVMANTTGMLCGAVVLYLWAPRRSALM